MTIVLDAGALIALDRGDRDTWSRLRTAFQNGDQVRAPAGWSARLGAIPTARYFYRVP